MTIQSHQVLQNVDEMFCYINMIIIGIYFCSGQDNFLNSIFILGFRFHILYLLRYFPLSKAGKTEMRHNLLMFYLKSNAMLHRTLINPKT